MGNEVFLGSMGLRIAQRRKDLRMTQEQLADQMGVSLQTISCIELGKKAIRPENLANLCVCLNVSADYILYGKRNAEQMKEIVAKLSALDAESYEIVRDLINYLHRRK